MGGGMYLLNNDEWLFNKWLCLYNTDFFFQHAVDPGTFELALVLQLINANTQLVATHSNKQFIITGLCMSTVVGSQHNRHGTEICYESHDVYSRHKAWQTRAEKKFLGFVYKKRPDAKLQTRKNILHTILPVLSFSINYNKTHKSRLKYEI